jgi:hypothetical protein
MTGAKTLIAYRIESDFTISLVEGSIVEILDDRWVWACCDYGGGHDIWYDDEGLFKDRPVLAWIGEARRVPLPVYITGSSGEESCDPCMTIDEVCFGPEIFVRPE